MITLISSYTVEEIRQESLKKQLEKLIIQAAEKGEERLIIYHKGKTKNLYSEMKSGQLLKMLEDAGYTVGFDLENTTRARYAEILWKEVKTWI